ncbi:MAG TPA: 4-hydroxy-tetrahydrodipicolinate synthase [Noviherbaspirillum sp.]|nr:4-hydroxy-tetrahydrodipicolinate synthase [Noviherbaspirillum sp.]
MTSFTGIWVPLVTPFQHGEIDFSALQALSREVMEAGVSGIVVCGSTGEAAALSEEEQLAVLDAILEIVPARKVVMGLAGNNLRAVVERQKHIQQRALAGLLVPPPYYIRPSQSGLIEYFQTLADNASIPLILYNIPYRTGVAMEFDTIRMIAQHERVHAIKDCGGDAMLTMRLIAESSLQVLAGEDHQLLSTLSLGGTGAILASAHIRPDLFVRVAAAISAGNLGEARDTYYHLLPMIRLLFQEPNPAPLKAALSMMGKMRDELRAPMQAASPTLRGQIERELLQLACL